MPIVEPEVLMEGAHTLARCAEVTADVSHQVCEQLHRQGVALEAMRLKPNMVLPGLACAEPVSLDDAADTTLSCLLRAVPAAMAGIAFLSGGQAAELATFGRGLQQPALSVWAGNDGNCLAAQRALLHRARCNAAAAQGAWRPAMEAEGLPT